MYFADLRQLFKQEPSYRFKQALEFLFLELGDDWSQCLNFPQNLREKLNLEFPLTIEAEISLGKNKDSQKALVRLEDNQQIETVLIRHKDERYTVCVSSQVGCPMGCTFCATGHMGFVRNLTDWEILMQILFWARQLKKTKERISNLVYMGMGEPFLNYDQVLSSIKLINDPSTLNIGARHISISTIGIIDGIKKLAKEKLQINLAVSLHAADNAKRQQIVPSAAKDSVGKIMNTVNDYIKKTKRRVMFEYLLIKNFNDSIADAQQLVKMLNNRLVFVNLIPYNATGKYQASDSANIENFINYLRRHNIDVTRRYTFGQDISAACGQLATKKRRY